MRRFHALGRLALLPGRRLAAACFGILLSASTSAQTTQRISVATGGVEANGHSSFGSSFSADGRYAAFHSLASNLVPGDTNGFADIFIRDRSGGTTQRVSVDSSAAEGNGASADPSISADGRYVVFSSFASNLVAADTNDAEDVFVHDRDTGSTERVSLSSAGSQGNDHSREATISGDGRFVAFASSASNLIPGDGNASFDVFVRDRQTGTTELASGPTRGPATYSNSVGPTLSIDGRYVAFQSQATGLVPGDTNGSSDVFLRDRIAGTTARLSVDSAGTQGNGNSVRPAISADGRYVTFLSIASNLVTYDTNGNSDVFVRDRQSDTTERVSLDPAGGQANNHSGYLHRPGISADGRYVVFESFANNLVSGDTNGFPDVFLRDRQSGTTELVSVGPCSVPANDTSGHPSISADGRYVGFESQATNLVLRDTNGSADAFVNLLNAPGFTSICHPGVDGVMACPCSNPPSGTGCGCDNSASTGGAVLFAFGSASLSADSLIFTTKGEKPTTLSIVLQGRSAISGGLPFGQGVRCAGGMVKRLYAKLSAGGSITAPILAEGDLPVAARSADLGDPIQPGFTRWYLVYYRDPVMLGACTGARTYNTTQTWRILWSQ